MRWTKLYYFFLGTVSDKQVNNNIKKGIYKFDGKKFIVDFVERELQVSKIALAFIFNYVKDLIILDIMVM